MIKDKHRYILVESSVKFEEHGRLDFESELYKELLVAVGEINYHKVNPKMIRFLDDNRFIIRCNLGGYKDLVVAFSLVKRLGERNIAFYTLKASGTIRALTRSFPVSSL